MKRKLYIKICFILVALIVFLFFLYQYKDRNDGKEETSWNVVELPEAETVKQEEKSQSEVDESREKDSAEVEKALSEEKEREKIELMDYVDLSVEEFIGATGIPLSRVDENIWNTMNADNIWYPESASVWLATDHDRIIYLSVYLWNTEAAFVEAFPYTVAGIRMGVPVSYYREGFLKNAVVEDVSYNDNYYTNLELSKQGVELLRLADNTGMVMHVAADIDLSLKENTEDMDYIWEERICQKEGSQNDRLKAAQEPYTKFPKYYREVENINETFVWIRYPYLAIPDRPEMEKNANDIIAEAVKKIEDRTCGTTAENLIVEADYGISYETSKFISIWFAVSIKDNSGMRYLWQYCNINMGENGRKAYLSDIGISKERITARCDAGDEGRPVDTESYLENYDTNWDQYYIGLTEYLIIVKPLYEEEEGEWNWYYGERTCSLGMLKPHTIL